MKKTELSLLICAFFISLLMCGCKFNLTNSKYLDRPDVLDQGDHFQIVVPKINKNTTSVTIYRKNVHEKEDSEIERVAILYPKGAEDTTDLNLYHDDYMVILDEEYRYFLRFTDDKGIRNRTEWSDAKKLTSGGASNKDQLLYDVNDLAYVWDPDTMIIKLPTGQDFTAPDNSVITDIASYKPALVFQRGETIQTFEVDDTKIVNLKALLPEDFLYVDISLLGIVGQKVKTNSEDANVKQSITWTRLAPVTIEDSVGIELSTIKLEPEHGEAGFDYSTTSDNEN